ncbi:MAG: NAD(P)-dependent oxidoreductase, partial [Steroidobacteraceae bacterium]|nr:NAD(P)-dependent oxidoreductase [Steroidobacteraceae bacterium]
MSSEWRRVGVIGLGAMGAPMARNLAKAGLLAAVWNRTSAKATQLAQETGAYAAASPADLARRCDAVLISVSADPDVLDVGARLLAADGLRAGQLVIDCSTVSAATARDLAQRLGKRGVDCLDAPVSGGVEGARAGTLVVMVGGPEAVLARAMPILQAIGRTIAHFGSHGAGQAAKATNQILCAGAIEAAAEAMAFAEAEGLPLDKLIATLTQGAGNSWYFEHRAPYMMRHDYPAGFRVRLHHKDLGICAAMA